MLFQRTRMIKIETEHLFRETYSFVQDIYSDETFVEHILDEVKLAYNTLDGIIMKSSSKFYIILDAFDKILIKDE